MEPDYFDDTRSDVTEIDNLNKECDVYPKSFSKICRTDLQHYTDTSLYYHMPSTMDLTGYNWSTHSSGYGTESDASYKTRDYFIARDLGI